MRGRAYVSSSTHVDPGAQRKHITSIHTRALPQQFRHFLPRVARCALGAGQVAAVVLRELVAASNEQGAAFEVRGRHTVHKSSQAGEDTDMPSQQKATRTCRFGALACQRELHCAAPRHGP
jgi:hypothetical protein